MKAKTCRVCRNAFAPTRPMQAVCGLECAKSVAVSIRGKAEKVAAVKERKADKAKREQLKTKADWAREAQAQVNLYVRLRDAALPCVSCGRHHQGQWHAGHFRSVGSAPHLRFDADRNIAKQCQPCNTHLHGNPIPFRAELGRRIGLQALEALECDQAPRHYSIDDLRALKAEYAAKARALKAAHG